MGFVGMTCGDDVFSGNANLKTHEIRAPRGWSFEAGRFTVPSDE